VGKAKHEKILRNAHLKEETKTFRTNKEEK